MPNRILKDSIRTSKSINALTDFQFRLWAYLITYVDDYGRGSAEPDILKGFVFPRRKSVTEANIQSALTEMACMGLIHLYEVDGDSYLCFPTWQKHQTVRAAKSKFPAPDDSCMQMQADESRCNQQKADSHVFDIRNTIFDNRNTLHDQVRESETDGFDDFWSAYPRKVSKQTALKSWKSGKLAKIADQIIADVKHRCDTEWKGQSVQYIPHPSTYLNQRRWEDETPPQEREEHSERGEWHNPALDYQQREYTAEDVNDVFIDLDEME